MFIKKYIIVYYEFSVLVFRWSLVNITAVGFVLRSVTFPNYEVRGDILFVRSMLTTVYILLSN